jgi:hypothetical protein
MTHQQTGLHDQRELPNLKVFIFVVADPPPYWVVNMLDTYVTVLSFPLPPLFVPPYLSKNKRLPHSLHLLNPSLSRLQDLHGTLGLGLISSLQQLCLLPLLLGLQMVH